MKKIAKWLAAISLAVFVIDWGVMGLKLLDSDYAITAEAYVGLVSFVAFFVCILCVKLQSRCPYCGKWRQSFGKYCPDCGKEIK